MFKKTVLFLSAFSLIFLTACSLKKEEVISPEEARQKAETFINENFIDPAYPIEIESIEYDKQTNLYKFSIDLGGDQVVESYISRDGKKLFPQAFSISEIEDSLEAEPEDNFVQRDVDNSIFIDAQSFASDKKVVVYFFWRDGCPYCQNQKTIISQWVEKYPDIEIKAYNTGNSASNGEIFNSLAQAYGTTAQGVPMTFIGDEFWIGYAESLGLEMEQKIQICLSSECENPGERIK